MIWMSIRLIDWQKPSPSLCAIFKGSVPDRLYIVAVWWKLQTSKIFTVGSQISTASVQNILESPVLNSSESKHHFLPSMGEGPRATQVLFVCSSDDGYCENWRFCLLLHSCGSPFLFLCWCSNQKTTRGGFVEQEKTVQVSSLLSNSNLHVQIRLRCRLNHRVRPLRHTDYSPPIAESIFLSLKHGPCFNWVNTLWCR